MTAPDRQLRVGFIGAGVLGTGLALSMGHAGYRVEAVSSRRLQSARCLAGRTPGCTAFAAPQAVADVSDLVFVTTPDSAIESVAAQVNWRPGQYVAHCCGALGRQPLEPARQQGAETGAFHPFQTFAGLDRPEQAVNRLTGVTFAVTAQGAMETLLNDLAGNLGGQAVAVAEEVRPLYHASAVLGCGYMVTLLEAAAQIWQAAGFSEKDALKALAPLARATLENVADLGPRKGVTGPLYRGDVSTVRQHLEALAFSRPDVADIYLSLTEKAVPLALELGLTPEGLAALDGVLAGYRSDHPQDHSQGRPQEYSQDRRM